MTRLRFALGPKGGPSTPPPAQVLCRSVSFRFRGGAQRLAG